MLLPNIKQRLEYVKEHEFFSESIEALKLFFEKNYSTPYPVATYEQFMIFYETGSRKEYESVYFEKRNRLATSLVLSLLFDDDKYLTDVTEGVWSILSEPTWALPAHTAEFDGSEYRKIIDLFAAETAMQLALISTLLGERLPLVLRRAMLAEIEDRSFDSFESISKFWWTNGCKSNWAAVCGGSLGVAYILLAPNRFAGVKDKINRIMASYVDGFCDDGVTTEGISYWFYGFSHYVFYADALLGLIGEDIFHSTKLDSIALFPSRSFLRNGHTVSFSDAMRTLRPKSLGLLSYLSKKYDQFVIPSAFEKMLIPYGSSCFQSLVYYYLWTDPSLFTSSSAESKAEQTYLPDAQWFISKQKKFSFAAKSGHNNEEHNHNDVGSFILVSDQGQIFSDLGSMEYTRFYFNNQYRYLPDSPCASQCHSVPLVGGNGQQFGKQYHGTVLASDDKFSIELQDAYGVGLPKITRTFSVCEDGMLLTDTFENGLPSITERFVSEIQPIFDGKVIRIASATVTAPTAPKIYKKTFSNHSAQPEDFWFIDFDCNEESFTLSVKFD